MRKSLWLAWFAIESLLAACAASPPHPEQPPPQDNRRPLHDAVADRSPRIEHQLAWSFGDQPGQAGPLLEGYAPGGAIAGSDELIRRLMKPHPDGSVDLQVSFVPSGDRISVITLAANDAKACAEVTKRAQQKWPKYASFMSDRLWLVWSIEDGTRAAWSAASTGCELRFEPWTPKVSDWLEQPDGAIELSLMDIVAARTRLGERVTGAKLAWSDPGLGVGVGPTTCEAIDDGGTKVTCRGSSSATTIEDMIAWLDKSFGTHAGPTVAASTTSAAFESDGTILTWNPTGPSLAVKLQRNAASWELEIRHVTPAEDPKRAAVCAKAAKSFDDGYSRDVAKQRITIVKDLCASTPWPSGTLACIGGRNANVDKCIEQMIPPLRHLLDTKLFVTR